jgi:hypothetical protein
MANNRTINSNQLTEGAIYLVRGKIAFCRITRPTTDKEREEANLRRVHKVDKNYTHITLYDSQVLAKDPQNPTLEEKYAAECMYTSSNAQHPNRNFSAMNKSPNLPKVLAIGENGAYTDIQPTAELAQGLDVTVMMRVFKGAGNKGVSLDSVLVNEPIRYYGGGGSHIAQTLEAYGINYVPPTPEQMAAMQQQQNQAVAPQVQPLEGASYGEAPTNAFAPAPANGYEQQNTFAPTNGYEQQNAFAPTNGYNATPVQPVQPAPPANDNPFSSYNGAAPAPQVTFGQAPSGFGPGPNRQY